MKEKKRVIHTSSHQHILRSTAPPPRGYRFCKSANQNNDALRCQISIVSVGKRHKLICIQNLSPMEYPTKLKNKISSVFNWTSWSFQSLRSCLAQICFDNCVQNLLTAFNIFWMWSNISYHAQICKSLT